MDLELLKQSIQQNEKQALGWMNGDLAASRARINDAYLSKPYGTELEGRSSIVTSDVFDTVEAILPGLIRVFTSGDEVAQFDPVSPEDEQAAKQETDYINHILTQKNDFLPFLQTWLRDGLISINGYAKAIWQVDERPQESVYQGLSEEEAVYLLNDKDIEVIGSWIDDNGITIKIKTVDKIGQVKIYNCPPEEVLVNPDHSDVSLKNARFVQHRPKMTISELRAMGYEVPDDVSDDEESDFGEEWQSRNRYADESGWFSEDDSVNDPSSRIVTFKETYIRYDLDGDGYAELRRICMVGDLVLSNEQVETIPIAAWTPVIYPHRHIGRSLAELVEDVQKVKTSTLRSALDSMYLSLNGRNVISDRVNMDDLLVSRPGGVVRLLEGAMPGEGHVMPLVSPDLSGTAYQMLEYQDSVRETRTGVTRYNQGLDANSLNKTATGIQSIMSASQARIELVARTFAETGMRDLMFIIHELVRKHSSKEEVIRIRNQWVPIDPRTWKTRYDMTISVGLGTGNREHQMNNIMLLMRVQQQAFPAGIVQPENIYHAALKLAESAGFKAPEQFFTDPANILPKPPAPDPKIVKIESDNKNAEADRQLKREEMEFDQKMQIVDTVKDFAGNVIGAPYGLA